jgi:catechol 2,3-dioxygenase-like lactoylglutathione lyase family enzyme
MLSYVYFGTSDLEKATAFYDAILQPLGMRRCITNDAEWDRISSGWGIYEDDGRRELAFWIGYPFNQRPASAGNGSMVAFGATSWKAVDDFHAAALANGGLSDGTPGLRPQYGRDFYAAFARDPDGNKLAAVCRGFTDAGS